MSLLLKTTLIFAMGTAVLFTQSHAAPIRADLGTLLRPYYYMYDQGKVQQDPVPDPGFGDWFTKISNGFLKLMARRLEDRDPKKIEVVKDFIKQMRIIASPATEFIQKYYPDDIVANNIMNAVNTYLSSLEKLNEEPAGVSKDIRNLMRMFNAVSS